MLSYTVAQCTKYHMQDHLFPGGLSKLLVVGIVTSEAFNSDMKSDPLHFDPFNVNCVALLRDGECVPYTQPLQPDFTNGLVARTYITMIHGLEMYNNNVNNGISQEDFLRKGFTLFVFNLIPYLCASGSCGQTYQTCNLRLEMKFSRTLTAAINVIVLAIRDGRLEITEQRQVIKCQ
jgi:hypothetical protein